MTDKATGGVRSWRAKTLAWWQGLLQIQRLPRMLVAHGVMGVAALSLAFVPLTNLLGYEFSLVVAVLLTVIVAPVTFGGLATPHAGSDRDGRETLAPPGPALTFARLAGLNMCLLVLPLLIISLNALRVRVCDFQGGLAIFLAIPVVTVLHTTLAALLAHGVVSGHRILKYVVYYGLLLISVLGGGAYLALEPPIVTVNPYIGYYAGSIYDEALAVPPPLIAYRLLHTALILALVGALEWRHRIDWRLPWPAGLRAGTLLMTVTVVVGHAHHADLGYALDREDIQRALGGRYETEHFVIYYPASSAFTQRIDEIAEDHEFRYAQLKAWFGHAPEGKLVSYIYPDRERKGALQGARRTLVAKLWLGEMHILYRNYGETIMKHELAHLFTPRFGSGPLKLSTTWGVFPNMGLVEGIATAAQWNANAFTPHGWSAAIHQLGKAPDMKTILSAGGFWSKHNRTVYTLMGSFCRWLIDTYGMPKFEEAYAHGEFEVVYAQSIETLVSDWQAFLKTVPLQESDLELARFYFDRPSIFGKVCARNLAERRRKVALLGKTGRFDEAADIMSSVVADDPTSPDYRHEWLRFLIAAGRLDEARERADELLAQQGIGGTLRAKVREEYGDIHWRQGEYARARAMYASVLATPGLSPEQRRVLQIKRLALSDPALRESLGRYFFDIVPREQQIARLYRVMRQQPAPEVAYVLGFQLFTSRAYEEARTHLERALALGLEGDEIVQKARELLAQALYFSGAYDEAAAGFETLQREGLREGDRARAADWLARTRWRRGWRAAQ